MGSGAFLREGALELFLPQRGRSRNEPLSYFVLTPLSETTHKIVFTADVTADDTFLDWSSVL